MATNRTPFDEMTRMMADVRQAMFGNDGVTRMGEAGGRFGAHVSVESDEAGYLVVADLPGFETEEIDLRFDDGMLLIEAEHEAEHDRDEDAVRMHSVHNRQVFERVRIPGTIDVDAIEATYANGVLEVRLPIVETGDDSGTVIDID